MDLLMQEYWSKSSVCLEVGTSNKVVELASIQTLDTIQLCCHLQLAKKGRPHETLLQTQHLFYITLNYSTVRAHMREEPAPDMRILLQIM
jgi:hypothetical protein